MRELVTSWTEEHGNNRYTDVNVWKDGDDHMMEFEWMKREKHGAHGSSEEILMDLSNDTLEEYIEAVKKGFNNDGIRKNN